MKSTLRGCLDDAMMPSHRIAAILPCAGPRAHEPSLHQRMYCYTTCLAPHTHLQPTTSNAPWASSTGEGEEKGEEHVSADCNQPPGASTQSSAQPARSQALACMGYSQSGNPSAWTARLPTHPPNMHAAMRPIRTSHYAGHTHVIHVGKPHVHPSIRAKRPRRRPKSHPAYRCQPAGLHV